MKCKAPQHWQILLQYAFFLVFIHLMLFGREQMCSFNFNHESNSPITGAIVLVCLQQLEASIKRIENVCCTFREKVMACKMRCTAKKFISSVTFLKALVLVFSGQLSAPEALADFNQILLQKRIPLRTINFPWPFSISNLKVSMDVILLVLNAKKNGSDGDRKQRVSSCG
jgi:hypothetical protein